MQKSIIPIKPFGPPKEGRRSLQYEIDLSNGSAVVDLTAVAMRGQISQIPMLFCDNADNDISVSIVMEGTLQRIVVPPFSQGYINLLLPQSPRVGFSCVGSIEKLNVNFLNFTVDELIWSVSSGMSGGTVTSVGLVAPPEFDVSGSPVTTAGDLTFEWFAVGAHTILAGPTGGAPGIPSFRLLVAADIPNLSGLYDLVGAAAAALVTAEAYTDAKIAAIPATPVSVTRYLLNSAASPYTPGAGCRQLKIRMYGGGGGGSGSGTTAPSDSVVGGNTTFNGIVAAGGGRAGFGSINANPGVGGTGGAGIANGRFVGGCGQSGSITAASGTVFVAGGTGGNSALASGGPSNDNTTGGTAPANSGGGGGGAGSGNTNLASSGGGGGAGEYVEYIINNPVGPYVYVVGLGGAGGSGGTSGFAGGNGGSGIIIAEELY